MAESKRQVKKSLVLTEVRAEAVAGYSFAAYLMALAQDGGLRKGERTDLRIRAAVCELLETVSLEQLKVQDICARVEVAQGTLYQYHADRDTLLARVLQDFVSYFRASMESATTVNTGHDDSVRLATAAYARVFAANRGLMKCLLNHYEAFPAARVILENFNREWIDTIVASVKRRRRTSGSGKRTSDAELMRRGYALGGMVDQYLTYLYLYEDRHVTAVAGDTDEVVRTLTFIWTQGFSDQFTVATS